MKNFVKKVKQVKTNVNKSRKKRTKTKRKKQLEKVEHQKKLYGTTEGVRKQMNSNRAAKVATASVASSAANQTTRTHNEAYVKRQQVVNQKRNIDNMAKTRMLELEMLKEKNANDAAYQKEMLNLIKEFI